MQLYSFHFLNFLLLHQCLAHDIKDQMNRKNSKNAVEELLKNINEISEQTFSNAPFGTKLEMLRKIEGKLTKAAKSLGLKGERYNKLIMKGIKSRALNKILYNNKTIPDVPTNDENISKLGETNNILNKSHVTKIFTKTQDSTEDNYDSSNLNRRNESGVESIKKNVNFILKEQFKRIDIVYDESDRSYQNVVTQEPTTEYVAQGFTPHYECENSLDKICMNIKQMRQLKCPFDDTVIPIEKLCDGIPDCIDRTDERFCISQVTERMQNANQVIHQTDESFQLNCFPNITKDSIMSSQIIVLRSVLQAQQEFVEKYKYFDPTLIPNNEALKEEGAVKNAMNEISMIISSLAIALDSELCSQRVKTSDGLTARKFNDLLVEDFDKIMDEVQSPPKSCICKEERCENITTCTDGCKRICWQKYSLIRWRCPSINQTELVPISVLCDGKFDCLDQSDEKDCVTGITFAKFEAHNMFKEILTSLSAKITSKEYEFIRNMLLSLHSTIEHLQKICMTSEPDLKMIRVLRNKCFSKLSSIYSETLTKSSFLYQNSEVYVYLLSINENLVNALKGSHTGNKRIITNDGCFCKNGRCSMPICSRNCVRSCIAEPILTRYFCENSLNKSLPLDDICDGKPNCPKEDDEARCEKEICRRHHLTLLRHNLQKIGQKQKGTAMGELLSAWKIKVSSTLLVAENSYRPNPNTMRDIVRDILNDLVVTYGAVKDYRKDNEYALEEFTNIAAYIKNFIKCCNY